MADRLKILMFSGSKKDLRYKSLSEAKVLHSHRIWAQFSSSTLHLLHNGLSDSTIRWRFILKLLCPCIPI